MSALTAFLLGMLAMLPVAYAAFMAGSVIGQAKQREMSSPFAHSYDER